MIRKAQKDDLPEVTRIYDTARRFMRENGNPTQWGNGYPSEELVSRDIDNGNLHLLTTDDGRIYACFGLFTGDDPTYDYIDGQWGDDTPYAAIHRVASDGSVRGVFRDCFNFVRSQFSHIRIDTHNDNITMQKAIEKCGFMHRGTIYVEDGTPRMAYEWTRS